MANTYKIIASSTVGSGGTANIEFSNIPQTYTDLYLHVCTRISKVGVAPNLNLTINNSTSNYEVILLYADGSTTGPVYSSALSGFAYWYAPGTSSTANTFGNSSVYIPSYTSSSYKLFSFDSTSENDATNADISLSSGLWKNNNPITNLKISNYAGDNLAEHSTAYLYGIKNS